MYNHRWVDKYSIVLFFTSGAQFSVFFLTEVKSGSRQLSRPEIMFEKKVKTFF